MADKDQRRLRWERRKGNSDGRTSKQGYVGGNPRYSGKSGYGGGHPEKSRY